jgi:hypothetical protein
VLPAIDMEKLRPSPAALKQLKGEILDGARGEEWLRMKVQSLECGDGVWCKYYPGARIFIYLTCAVTWRKHLPAVHRPISFSGL